jgi:hypothetical protein
MMCTFKRSHIIVNPAQAQMISEWTGRSLEDLERGNGLIVSQPLPARRSLDVARAAAKVAVAASKRTGRPVDPRVAKLAECPPQP